ncbi:hypothetical protein JXA56_00175 [Candidatus Micrarchaeota archaeon]|nr:hypothetical protein [Candidatus Micrarchaeota archaeon]
MQFRRITENFALKPLVKHLQNDFVAKASQYAKLVGISKPIAVNDLNELIKQEETRQSPGVYYELENVK